MYDANAANDAAGGYDVPDAHLEPAADRAPLNVYHPLPEASLSYEEYADPAAAHGWQNAYDETAELPPVADRADGAHQDPGAGGTSGGSGGYDYVYEVGYDYGDDYVPGRGGRRSHRGRHQPAVWRSRRVAIAAGALGVASAALIAGFSLSGSSSAGDSQGKHDRTSPTAGDSAAPTEVSGDASADARPSYDTESPRNASSSASTSPSASEDTGSGFGSDDKKTPSPDPTTTSSAPPASTPTATRNAPGNSDDKPGQGQGSTKKPG